MNTRALIAVLLVLIGLVADNGLVAAQATPTPTPTPNPYPGPTATLDPYPWPTMPPPEPATPGPWGGGTTAVQVSVFDGRISGGVWQKAVLVAGVLAIVLLAARIGGGRRQ